MVDLDCYELADIYMSLVLVYNLGKEDLKDLIRKISKYMKTECWETYIKKIG